jgi:hypothetical protein
MDDDGLDEGRTHLGDEALDHLRRVARRVGDKVRLGLEDQ